MAHPRGAPMSASPLNAEFRARCAVAGVDMNAMGYPPNPALANPQKRAPIPEDGVRPADPPFSPPK